MGLCLGSADKLSSPITIGGLCYQPSQHDAHSKGVFWMGEIVFVTDMNIVDLQMDIVDDQVKQGCW